jgi:hypothetical protein
MRLAVFVAATTPSDSPSASHLPQEEGFSLRRFASDGCGVSRSPRQDFNDTKLKERLAFFPHLEETLRLLIILIR